MKWQGPLLMPYLMIHVYCQQQKYLFVLLDVKILFKHFSFHFSTLEVILQHPRIGDRNFFNHWYTYL